MIKGDDKRRGPITDGCCVVSVICNQHGYGFTTRLPPEYDILDNTSRVADYGNYKHGEHNDGLVMDMLYNSLTLVNKGTRENMVLTTCYMCRIPMGRMN